MPRKKKSNQKKYLVGNIACPSSDLYITYITNQETPDKVLKVISGHLKWAEGEKAAAIARATIKQWATKGVKVKNDELIFIGEPFISIKQWILPLRKQVKALAGNEIQWNDSLSVVAAETQSMVTRKIRLERKAAKDGKGEDAAG
jgi:hypothetical protein